MDIQIKNQLIFVFFFIDCEYYNKFDDPNSQKQ